MISKSYRYSSETLAVAVCSEKDGNRSGDSVGVRHVTIVTLLRIRVTRKLEYITVA